MLENYEKIENHLIEVEENKNKAFKKNKELNYKKKNGLIRKLEKDYLPELEKIDKLIIKKNFEFFE